MKTIQRILVPTDFSPSAINAMSYAIWFADLHDAAIHVIHVVFPGTGELDVPVISASDTQQRIQGATEAMKAFVGASLSNLNTRFTPTHIPEITTEIRVGTPVAEIFTAAKGKDADLIIVGTRAKHGALDDMFGSVATGLVSRARIPVIVIPEQYTHYRLNACCYATPLDESDPFFIWRTRNLFGPTNPIIHVVHVDPPGRKTGDISLDELKDMMAGRLASSAISYQILQGKDVVEELHGFADEREVDLVVMRTTHRNLLQRLIHESVTRKMSLHGRLPTCIMKGETS